MIYLGDQLGIDHPTVNVCVNSPVIVSELYSEFFDSISCFPVQFDVSNVDWEDINETILTSWNSSIASTCSTSKYACFCIVTNESRCAI